MRAINATPASWLGNRLGLALLAEMDFASGMLYATSAPIDIAWNGNTYLGGRQVGVEEVKDQGGEVQGLRFNLSGVPSEMIALALAESLQGRSVVLRVALLDPDTHAIGDVLQIWSGSMDQMPVRHGAQTSSITVTAEHRGIAFARPKPLRYSDADQRRVFPGDRALEFLISQAQQPDIWPSAEYFKK